MMTSNNISNVPSFVSRAQTLVPIMHHRLSGDPHKKVAISKLLTAKKPLIVPFEEADADCATLEDFLAMLDIRINAEYVYREEIMQLKNNICNEFNKLCDGVSDENFIKFVRDQRQLVINAVVDETKIEHKMIADQFFNDIINGFEEKALNFDRFSGIVWVVLWKPLLAPFPTKLMNEMKNLMQELGVERSTIEIKKIASKLIEYIKEHLIIKEIKDTDFKSSRELRLALEKLTQERQTCNVELKNLYESEGVIKEFMSKCIEKVKIIAKSSEFLEREIKINYEEIDWENVIKGKEFDELFGRTQRTVKSLKARFGKGSLQDYQKMSKSLSRLKNLLNLNLKCNGIEEEEVKALLATFNELKNISTLALDFGNNNIGEKGAEAISVALEGLKSVSIIDLNLSYNEIGTKGAQTMIAALKDLKNILSVTLNFLSNNLGDEGVTAASAALKNLKNISALNLNFGGNNIGEKGAKAVAAALKELKNISALTLNFSDNKIGKEGAKAISAALKDLKNISALNLSFMDNEIEEEGLKAVSTALKELKNISVLDLDFSNNKIGDEGAKEVSAGLKELKNVLVLNLNFWCNNIKCEGAKAISALLSELKTISTLNLTLRDNNIGDEEAKTVSAALRELVNVSTLKLNFQRNNIGHEGATAVSAALKQLKKISTLSLNIGQNSIGEEGVIAVSAALQELKKISVLDLNLRCNGIEEEGARSVATTLKELKNISMVTIFFGQNSIGQGGREALNGLKLFHPSLEINFC